MRRLLLLAALPAGLLVGAPAALAQHWNDTGPGRDLLGSTITEFDVFRQRAPAPQAVAPGMAGAAAAPSRAPIPILDWVPPPQQAAPAPAPRRTATRSARPRSTPRAAPVAATPRAPVGGMATGTSDWERSFADRERELDRLRRILEEDRLRYNQVRQPQLQ